MLLLSTLLADANAQVFALPDQMQSLLAVGMWVMIGAGVIGTAAAAVSIWSNLRRQPSADLTFASKAELLAAEDRMSQRVDHALHGMDQQQKTIMDQQRAIFSKIDATNRTLNEHALEMERAIGRLEGGKKS